MLKKISILYESTIKLTPIVIFSYDKDQGDA